jgi:hypothetical protein
VRDALSRAHWLVIDRVPRSPATLIKPDLASSRAPANSARNCLRAGCRRAASIDEARQRSR